MSVELLFKTVLLGAVIFIAGRRLTIDADEAARRFRWGHAWIGMVLLAGVTSLPELAASWQALSMSALDLAVGNLMGSNTFNPLLIVIGDFFYPRQSLTDRMAVTAQHGRMMLIAALLTVLAVSPILVPSLAGLDAGPMNLISWIVAGVYLWAVRLQQQEGEPVVHEPTAMNVGTGCLVMRLLVAASAVVLAAAHLAVTLDHLARVSGMGRSFVGAVFLAALTSLPELAVTVTAIRRGWVLMALGNIFGSNMFNMFAVALCDGWYPAGGFYQRLSLGHLFPAGLSLMLTALAALGMRLKPKKTWLRLGWDTWAMGLVYLGGLYVFVRFRG